MRKTQVYFYIFFLHENLRIPTFIILDLKASCLGENTCDIDLRLIGLRLLPSFEWYRFLIQLFLFGKCKKIPRRKKNREIKKNIIFTLLQLSGSG